MTEQKKKAVKKKTQKKKIVKKKGPKQKPKTHLTKTLLARDLVIDEIKIVQSDKVDKTTESFKSILKAKDSDWKITIDGESPVGSPGMSVQVKVTTDQTTLDDHQ